MKTNKLLTLIASTCLVLGVSSCANMEAQDAANAAQAEIDKAKAMGNEWRDSRKILGKAQAALDNGDVETANKLIEQARKQGLDAQAQAKAQTNAGPR